MTQSPARAGVPPDALELLDEKGSAERALTAALASFQEQVQAVPSLDLAAVVEAARPALPQALPSVPSWSTSAAATSCASP
jgi:hypothetical protein